VQLLIGSLVFFCSPYSAPLPYGALVLYLEVIDEGSESEGAECYAGAECIC